MHRSKEKPIESLKHHVANPVRKTKSKPSGKPQTAQINLFANPLIQSKIKEGKDIQNSIRNKDKQSSNSALRKNKIHPVATNYVCKKKPKIGSNMHLLNKTQPISTPRGGEKSPSTKRESFGSSIGSDPNKFKTSAAKIKHIKAKIIKSKDTRNNQIKHITYNEYFARKRSNDKFRPLKNQSMGNEMSKRHSHSTILSKVESENKLGGGNTKRTSYERSQPDLLISISNPHKDSSVDALRIENSLQSPSLKSIAFPFTTTSKFYSENKKRGVVLKKYKEKVEKFQVDSFKKKSQVKSNRVLPKYQPSEIQTEYSKKSLGISQNTITNSFQGENLVCIKPSSLNTEGPKMTKHKSISQKRLNDSIFKSLNEIKKSLKK